MSLTPIQISTQVDASKSKVWSCYTLPEHIVNWNFADPSWHCPSASNNLKVGGTYLARMEAKDGSFGFGFEAIYTEVIKGEKFTYSFGDRLATVTFNTIGDKTELSISFDPETENDPELQKKGWQAILNNFKKYVEGLN